MKKLHMFMLKSFMGPFAATFLISMFVLLMQFLWRYIDEIVGKGLDISIIIEFLFYVSATLVPMALPLAVLLASIMTFGSLGENYELIALKAAGISLYRIMYPLIILIVGLTIFAFFFANNMLPVANLKASSLLYDIKRHKPELSFKEGVFTNDMPGYSIKVDRINKDNGMMYGMLIYNHTVTQGNYEVTKADSGLMVSNPNTNTLELVLHSGHTYTDEGMQPGKKLTFPFRRLKFDKQSVLIELPGNELKRTDEDLFRSSAMMLTVGQLEYAIDSIRKQVTIKKSADTKRLLSGNYERKRNMNPERDSVIREMTKGQVADIDSLYRTYDPEQRQRAIDYALQYARDVKQYTDTDKMYYLKQDESVRTNQIQWHKKFTLSFACFIFFFIGAPLGAIIRKGGLGMPVVVSIFLFIIYYIISMMGERSAQEGVIPSMLGAWLSSIILLPLGIILTYKSVTDSEIMSTDAYRIAFSKILNKLKRSKDDKDEEIEATEEPAAQPEASLRKRFHIFKRK